jgi:hypothetical protein
MAFYDKFLLRSFYCSFVLIQKNQKIKANPKAPPFCLASATVPV